MDSAYPTKIVEKEKFVDKCGLQGILVTLKIMKRNSSKIYKKNIHRYQSQVLCLVFVSKQLMIVTIILMQIYIFITQKWTGVIIAQLSMHQKPNHKLRSELKSVRDFLFES